MRADFTVRTRDNYRYCGSRAITSFEVRCAFGRVTHSSWSTDYDSGGTTP